MKKYNLFFVALLSMTCQILNAQVVYDQEESKFVKGTTVEHKERPTTLTAVNPLPDQNATYGLSSIGSNWFASIQGGMNTFVGNPKGCEDFFGRIKPTVSLQLGKWHSPFFGTRLSADGFQLIDGNIQSVSYQNYHGDLLFDLGMFFHRDKLNNGGLPRWRFVPFVGAGVIHNQDLHSYPFAISYGFFTTYKINPHLGVIFEAGGTSTKRTFDGLGDGNRFGDNLFHLSLGLNVSFGHQGYKTIHRYPHITFYEDQENYDQKLYVPKEYSGLKSLMQRINGQSGISDTNAVDRDNIAQFDAPILFFFKKNSCKLVDPQQKHNIIEIAGAVKQYDLQVKIIGAADSKTGSEEHNRILGRKRCIYIAKLLIKAGVDKHRMKGLNQGGINVYSPYPANRHTCVILYKAK